MMLKFNSDGDVEQDFKGKTLVKGETDGSSFPNGGLRGTHCAGGYLAVDTSSPILCRGDTIFIPSAFVSYYGHALDEKTPLLRASDALSKEGSRLCKLLGYDTEAVTANIGLEQEIFLIPRDVSNMMGIVFIHSLQIGCQSKEDDGHDEYVDITLTLTLTLLFLLYNPHPNPFIMYSSSTTPPRLT